MNANFEHLEACIGEASMSGREGPGWHREEASTACPRRRLRQLHPESGTPIAIQPKLRALTEREFGSTFYEVGTYC